MSTHTKLSTKELALAVTFTALYAVLGLMKISPIIGLPGQAITAAAIIAPLIGIILGPYLGTLSTLLGGAIGFSLGFLSQPSFASGIAAALSAGLVRSRRRVIALLFYVVLWFSLAFYPTVGPAWLYPAYLTFQAVGLIILIPPFQSTITKGFNSYRGSWLVFAYFATCLASTLAGQIAGSLAFVTMVGGDVAFWTGTWLVTALTYPVERLIIAAFASIIALSLHRVLRSANLLPSPNRGRQPEKHP